MKLAVILAFLFFGLDAKIPDTDPCDNLKVTTEIKHTTDGLANGEVEVKVEGGVEPITVTFYNENKEILSKDITLKNINLLKKGIVYFFVKDGSGCVTNSKAEIE